MSAFKELINGETPVIVHLTAEWATPSIKLSETLVAVKQNLNDSVKMIKIDVEKNPDIATKFQVVGLPCLLLFKEGSIKWRHNGLIDELNLTAEIKKHQ